MENNNNANQANNNIGDQNNNNQNRARTMHDFISPNIMEDQSSIIRPTVANNNFEIKPVMIQIVQNSQFNGLPYVDASAHLIRFLEYHTTIKMNGVSKDAIRLLLFPFSLNNRAQRWFTKLPPNSIHTWPEMYNLFFNKYFSPAKVLKDIK